MVRLDNHPFPSAAASATGSTLAARILVVDDHDDTRLMLRTFLEMQNYDVLEAVDGQTALDATLAHQPDLILMDLSLPKVDGLTATRLIRGHDGIAQIPIVFLSGRAEPARRQAALDAGCNDYLTKPVEIEDMMAVIARWLRPGLKKAERATNQR